MFYKMFGLNIKIDFIYKQNEFLLKDYLLQAEVCDNIDMDIQIGMDELKGENKISPGNSEEYNEFVCIFRHITEEIIDFDGLFIHSAVVKKDNCGYMFLGKSGVGKTTHAMLWEKQFGQAAKIINGDKPIIRMTDNSTICYGNPWCGKEMRHANENVRLKAACFLSQGKENKICRLNEKEVFPLLLNQTVIPKDIERKKKFFELTDKFIKSVQFYKMECDVSTDAVMYSYNAMRGE